MLQCFDSSAQLALLLLVAERFGRKCCNFGVLTKSHFSEKSSMPKYLKINGSSFTFQKSQAGLPYIITFYKSVFLKNL
jgi:hypothetical protein